jgi:hypothetical protein
MKTLFFNINDNSVKNYICWLEIFISKNLQKDEFLEWMKEIVTDDIKMTEILNDN